MKQIAAGCITILQAVRFSTRWPYLSQRYLPPLLVGQISILEVAVEASCFNNNQRTWLLLKKKSNHRKGKEKYFIV
jgi:hypothetical protein